MDNTNPVDERPVEPEPSPTSRQPSPQQNVSHMNSDQMKQLLDAFQMQLEVQQKQLAILQQLAMSGDDKSRDKGKAVASASGRSVQADSSGTSENHSPEEIGMGNSDDVEQEQEIKERAVAWREARSPVAPTLAKLGKDFLAYCMNSKLWWFSESLNDLQRYDIFYPGQTYHPDWSHCQYNPAEWFGLIMQRWPKNLGTVNGNQYKWILAFSNPSVELASYCFDTTGSRWINMPKSKKTGTMYDFSNEWTGLGSAGYFLSIESLFDSHPFPLEVLCLILLQLQFHLGQLGILELEGFPGLNENSLHSFLVSHLSKWQDTINFSTRKETWNKNTATLSITHMIRYFDFSPFEPLNYRLSLDTLPLSRETARFVGMENGENVHLYEKRTSIALVSELGESFPPFTIVHLADYQAKPLELRNDILGDHRFVGEHGFVGVIHFLELLGVAIEECCSSWKSVLEKLDSELSVTIGDLFDDKASRSLMFDDKVFSRSKLYFNVQQLCRMFGACIEETIRNLHEHREDFVLEILDNRWAEVNAGKPDVIVRWNTTIDRAEGKLRPLLERFNRKREEVESLRDGLFNATSVREASKGTDMSEISVRQNQYIFIFTVATVFYLPLGFVTSVFGMHLYDTTDPGVVKARPKFWAAILVISIATYVIAGLGYWVVRKGKKDYLREWFRGIRGVGGEKKKVEKGEKGEEENNKEREGKGSRGFGLWKRRDKGERCASV